MHISKSQQEIHFVSWHSSEVCNGRSAHLRLHGYRIVLRHIFHRCATEISSWRAGAFSSDGELWYLFRPMIQGCKLLICCDHKNIMNAMTQHKNLRVLCQIVKLDQEYQAEFEHLAGELNVGGDGFSRLRMLDHVLLDFYERVLQQCT
jgi:hypothetical protein